MNSTLDGCRATRVPAAMASAWRALSSSTKRLKDSTSSALVMVCGGWTRPVPLMTTECIGSCPMPMRLGWCGKCCDQAAWISCSSLAASAAKARMPSASFSVAMASALSA